MVESLKIVGFFENKLRFKNYATKTIHSYSYHLRLFIEFVGKCMSHMTKKDADRFVSTMLDTIKRTVKKGDDVSLIGFGTFGRVRRKARTGVNPATGERIKIKAKTLPKFRPGKELKDYVKKG